MTTRFALTLTTIVFAATLAGCPEPTKPTTTPKTPPPVAPTNAPAPAVVEPVAPAEPDPVPVVEPIAPADAVPVEDVMPAEPVPADAAPTLVDDAPVAAAAGYPPVADLDAAIKAYIERVEKAASELAETQDFAADSEAFVRDASALALLASGAAQNDGSQYQKSAAPLVAAAVAAMSAANADTATSATAAIKVAATAEGDPATLASGKIVPLAPVMKAVPNISSAVNRAANSDSKLKRAGDRVVEGIAAMAVIVHHSRPNVAETVKPDAEAEWLTACDDFSTKAIEANTAAHAFLDGNGDFAAFETAFTAMNESCNTCHQTFHPTGITTTATE